MAARHWAATVNAPNIPTIPRAPAAPPPPRTPPATDGRARAGRLVMMSGGRTAPLNPVRVEKAALFYNWSPFFALNTLNVIGSAVTLLLLWPAAQAAAAGGEQLSALTTAAVRVGTRVTAVFVGALGAGSLVAGVAVGCKISHVARDAADLDATLRGAARAKLRKIAIAAAAFSGAAGCRAAVLYRATLAGTPPPRPAVFVGLGLALPELLPTLVALLVLRRRPLADCCGGICGKRRAAPFGRALAGVDPTPLRAAEGGSTYEGGGAWRIFPHAPRSPSDSQDSTL